MKPVRLIRYIGMGVFLMALNSILAPSGCGGPVRLNDMPPLGMSQKQSVEMNLDAYLQGNPNTVTFTVSGATPSKVNVQIDNRTHVATLSAATDFSGEVTLRFTATDTSGASDSTDLLVKVHANVRCETVMSFDAGGQSFGRINAAGEWNGWSTTADQMTDPDRDGIYSIALDISPGYYQYKFVIDGWNWFLDPANPYKAWLNGFLNSEVQVLDCGKPKLEVESLSVDPSGAVDVVVHYVDGANGSGPDEQSLSITENGRTILDDGWDSFERSFFLRLNGLSQGKHTLRFNAEDENGRSATERYVPVWIERSPFDWRDAILYHAFTDRFNDGNTGNNRNVNGVPYPSNNQGGDFAGITKKIRDGYFTDLGINAIWLSPVIQNADNAEYGADGRLYTAYHGYWPSEPRTVEDLFGGDADLKELINTAHGQGIRILFDLTANHVHDAHGYFRTHSDWINAYDWCGDGDSWNLNPIGCWFMDYLPDLNYQHPDALHTLIEDSLFWVREYDADGFRVDAVKHMETVFEEHLRARLRSDIENDQVKFYMVGETFVGDWDWGNTSNQTIIKEHVSDARLNGQFDFPLYWDIVRVFARNERSIPDLEAVLSETEDYYGSQAIMSNFLGNLDVPRFISHANGDIYDVWGNGSKEQGWNNPPNFPSSHEPYQRLQLAFTFLMTINGVPLIYYGDEIGLPGAGDPDNRRKMIWDNLGSYSNETLNHLQKLGQARRAHQALSRGARIPLFTNDADVWVYAKTLLGDKLIVALNRSGNTRTVTVNVLGTGIPNGRTLEDELSNGNITVSNGTVTITLGPWQGAIYAM